LIVYRVLSYLSSRQLVNDNLNPIDSVQQSIINNKIQTINKTNIIIFWRKKESKNIGESPYKKSQTL